MALEDHWHWNSESKLGLEVSVLGFFHPDPKLKAYNPQWKVQRRRGKSRADQNTYGRNPIAQKPSQERYPRKWLAASDTFKRCRQMERRLGLASRGLQCPRDGVNKWRSLGRAHGAEKRRCTGKETQIRAFNIFPPLWVCFYIWVGLSFIWKKKKIDRIPYLAMEHSN